MKFRIVLASHGELAKGMLNTVQMLLGPQENMTAYCLSPEQDVEQFKEILRKEVEENGAENVIFMTELIHGSPFNSVVDMTRDMEIYHVSGTNLPTLMGAVLARDEDDATAESICEAAIEASQQSIIDVRKMLAATDKDDEEEDL